MRPYQRTTDDELDEVLRMYLTGHSNAQICAALSLKPKQLEYRLYGVPAIAEQARDAVASSNRRSRFNTSP